MQSIQTRYLGPTNSRGSRIKAYSEAFPRGVTVAFEYGIGDAYTDTVTANHDAAARAFIEKFEWHGTWARGGSADGRGNVYVCLMRQRDDGTLKTPHPQSAYVDGLIVVRRP